MLKMILNIRGRVQQVGYRYSVVNYILEGDYNVTGYTKNLSDGSVEVVAEGELEDLKSLHRFCLQGPPRSEVREIEQTLVPINRREFSEFVIIS